MEAWVQSPGYLPAKNNNVEVKILWKAILEVIKSGTKKTNSFAISYLDCTHVFYQNTSFQPLQNKRLKGRERSSVIQYSLCSTQGDSDSDPQHGGGLGLA